VIGLKDKDLIVLALQDALLFFSTVLAPENVLLLPSMKPVG
jgi:hypothetical protein